MGAGTKDVYKRQLYGERLERAVARMEADEKNGMPPERIADAVYRAAMKRRPKPLFTVCLLYTSLVRTDHRRAAQRFHAGQVLDDGLVPRHFLYADGQHDCHDRRQPFGDGDVYKRQAMRLCAASRAVYTVPESRSSSPARSIGAQFRISFVSNLALIVKHPPESADHTFPLGNGPACAHPLFGHSRRGFLRLGGLLRRFRFGKLFFQLRDLAFQPRELFS